MSRPAVTTQDRQPSPYWWMHVLTYAVLVYCFPLLVPDLPWWSALLTGGAIGLFGALAARARFHYLDYGRDFTAAVTACAAVIGACTATWLLVAKLAGGPQAIWQWLVLGAIVCGGWWGWLMFRAPRMLVTSYDPAGRPDTAAAPTDDAVAEYQGILRRVGCTDLKVTRVEKSPTGRVETVFITPTPEPGKKAMNYGAFAGKTADIATEVSRTLEVSRGLDTIMPFDVLPEMGKNSHSFMLHVTLEKAVGQSIPYKIRLTPREHHELMVIGDFQDDRPIEMRLCSQARGASHMTVIGMTGSGKGNLLNVFMAELLSSDATEVWACAAAKLTQLVYSWLVPWIEGRTDRPALDRVAGESQTEILQMLADALQYASLCNQKLGRVAVRPVSPGKSYLAVIIDESSEALENKQKISVWDGRVMNASEIVAALKQLARTSPVSVIDASQYALFTAAGTQGSKQRRNTGTAICLKVKRRQDMSAVMPGLPAHVNPTRLSGYQMFVQPDTEDGEEEPRIMRGKAAELWGPLIDPVVLRVTQWRTGLDPEITKHLQFYADRWSAKHHKELVQQAADEGFGWPGSAIAPEPAEAAPVPVAPLPDLAPAEEGTPAEAPAPPAPVLDAPPLPEVPAGALPGGWEDEGFDVWAAFADDPKSPEAPQTDGVLPAADTSGIRRAVEKIKASRAAKAEAMASLPDPVGSVISALSAPGAPRDWVSTDQLAGVIGRYDPAADTDTRRRAAEQLGLELSKALGIKTGQKQVKGVRSRGYEVPVLLDAVAKLLGS